MTPGVVRAFERLGARVSVTMRSLRVVLMALFLFSAITSLAMMSVGVRSVHVREFRSASEGQLLDAWSLMRHLVGRRGGGGYRRDAATRFDEYGFPTFRAMCSDLSLIHI